MRWLERLVAALIVAGITSGVLFWTGSNNTDVTRGINNFLSQNESPAAATPSGDPARCHARGTGLYALPDPHCTPGETNSAVTPATIHKTICVRGWTSTVRPSERITEPEKYGAMAAYGYSRSAARSLEYDHLIPLELGGATNDPRNLWPELDYSQVRGYDHNPKDALEYRLNRLVCDGQMPLATAQRAIAANWAAAYSRYPH
jgi:hypothetical protein